MTYRDPLYDANPSTTNDVTGDVTTGTGQSDSTTGNASEKADELKAKGQGMAEEKLGDAKAKGEELAGTGKEKAAEMGGQAQEKADEGLGKAAEGLGTAADRLREQGEQRDGAAGTYATTAADKLEQASGYLREKDTNQLVGDLEELVRRRPMESLIAAAGIGLLLSRIVK